MIRLWLWLSLWFAYLFVALYPWALLSQAFFGEPSIFNRPYCKLTAIGGWECHK